MGGITTLTGLKEIVEYTYSHSQGNRVVDHICIDEEHVEVIRKLKNRKEVMGRIDTDHSMVVGKIKIRNSEERKTGQQRNEGTKKSERRRKVSRIKKKEVWEQYKEGCNKSMELARVIDGLDRNIEGRENTVENAWQEIKRAARKLEEWIEEIADKEGDIKYKYINKQIRSEREIAEKIERKIKAWKQLKECKDEEYIKILRKRYSNCKNVLNKARKRLRKEHKRKVIREIESLNTRYPGEYWRLLNQSTGRKKKKKKAMRTMIDEEGYEVEGEEIKRVWKEAFEKLGKKGGQDTFDEKFSESVEKGEEEIEQTSKERGS